MSSLSARALDAMLAAGPMSILAKVTVTLAAAGVVAVLASRASAAIRHLIWLTALVACAALVFVTPIAPRIRVTTRSARGIVQLPRVASTAVSMVTVRPARVIAASFAPRRFVTVTAPRVIPVTARLMLRRMRSWSSRHAGILLAALWATGFFAVIGRFTFGLVGVRRLVDSSTPLDEYGWTRDLMLAAEATGVERPVRLMMHASLSSPITAGSVFPVVMVPVDADEWSPQRRRVVLVHELAHIARLDFAAQFLATIMTAVFWFHPLVWFAAARLRDEAEQAADDYVIADGTPGVAYASHLLDIARAVSPHHLAAVAAVGMVRSTRLETRFRAMLDGDRPRSALSMQMRLAAVIAVAALMVPFAGLRSAANAGPRFARGRVVAPRMLGRTIVTAPGVIASRRQLIDSLIDRAIDAQSGRKLILDLETGAGVTIHAWDQARIRVRGALGGRDWRDARFALDRVGADVRVSTTLVGGQRTWSTDISIEIWAPRRTDVEIKSAGGSIEVDGLQGTFSGETGGGSIVMDGATGRASLSTGGGRILVTDSDLSGSITTGGGEVITRNSRGSLTTSSNSGYSYSAPTTVLAGGEGIRAGIATGISTGVGTGISTGVATTIAGGIGAGVANGITTNIARGFGVGIGQGVGACSASISNSVGSTVVSTGGGFGYAPGRVTSTTTNTNTITNSGSRIANGYVSSRVGDAVQIHKPGGSIDLDDAPSGATVSTGGGSITVGPSRGSVVASTGGGDINLESVAGDAVASTGSGTVTISVVNSDGTEHSISVCSGHGDVILELPAQLDASIELETAYTDNFGRTTSIDSDIPLSRNATTEWDDRFGTPRKFVRASAVAGNGAGRIRVQTVNGDIVIRRR